MIEFTKNLPSFSSGTYNMPESGFPCHFSVQDAALGEFIAKLREIVREDRRLFFIDGRCLMLSINWIRDHIHESKGFKHWEYDLRSFFDFILDYQTPEGFFFEMIKQSDEMHHTFVSPDYTMNFPEDNLAVTRLEIEADIEYLMVEGAVTIYRVTGDDAWIQKALPKLEKGIDYMTSDPKRFCSELGLVKRAFTIDTWDFVCGKSNDNRRIEEDTPMSVMHGDNSGVYQAMRQLAWLRRRFGDEEKALAWEQRAEMLRENMFKHLWNGTFFIHQRHLNHNGADHLENERLSLSDTYDINRGVTNFNQSRGIIDEFLRRRRTTQAFAEWFSVDPAYERFGNIKKGNYINGGITPFTAGELALAAFNNGYEAYGWDILKRVQALVKKDGTLYFLYNPITGENIGGGPSGWGAASVMTAIEEGVAGIRDLDVKFNKMSFSPRWSVTDYNEFRYVTGYELSGVKVDVKGRITAQGMRYVLETPSVEIQCHLLLPEGKKAASVAVNGNDVPFKTVTVVESVYADTVFLKAVNEKADICVLFENQNNIHVKTACNNCELFFDI